RLPPRVICLIIFCAWVKRSMSWLTAVTVVPAPLAMRARRNARWRRHAADARNGWNARWRRGPQEEGRGEEEGPQGRSVRQPGQAGAGGEGAGGQEGRQDQGSGRLGLRRRRPGQGRGIRSGEPAERLRRNLPRWQEVAPSGTIDSCTFALGACPLNRAEVIVRA